MRYRVKCFLIKNSHYIKEDRAVKFTDTLSCQGFLLKRGDNR